VRNFLSRSTHSLEVNCSGNSILSFHPSTLLAFTVTLIKRSNENYRNDLPVDLLYMVVTGHCKFIAAFGTAAL
jgi:hypothetical protein